LYERHSSPMGARKNHRLVRPRESVHPVASMAMQGTTRRLAIEVEHLSKHYGEIPAVIDLSFTVEEGRCTAFLGPNGAGKTTTIKTLYGKARADARTETRIRVLGFDLPEHELEAKSLCGLVPQEDSLDEELDIEQNLSIFARFYHMPRRKAFARINELLSFMELSEKRHARVKELSGGMKRRLVIARALLNNPRLLILDEPTTGLDPHVRHLIWDRMRDLMRGGVTLLLTTHYMDEAFQLAHNIIIMDKGRKALEGAPQRLLADHMEPYVLEAYDPAEEGTATSGKLREMEAKGDLRREASSSRVLFYARTPDALDAVARELRPGSFLRRATNLEDLFLRITGRNLNE
jgi:lipooligosaccharide transport system ATP-binding protein